MSNSNDQYKSIPIEFLKADFGYSKMGRCVTSILPKSEAARLGVKVGWLELNVERRTMSNHKKRRRNKSKSKSQTYLVHFLAPRRRIFYKVVWKALASTHCKMEHPQRKIVGSVELGIVLWVMDIVKNRALVACPKSGWNRDVSGWLPDAPFAWLSIRAKDGTDILKNISEAELYTSIRSSTLSRSSTKTTMYSRSHSSRSTRMQLPAIRNAARFRSHYPVRKRTIPLDFRENKVTTKPSHLSPSPIQVDRVISRDSTSGKHFTTSQEHSQRVFIDLEFKETKENPMPQNYLPLDFKIETAVSDDVDSQIITSLESSANSKISLTRSKTLSDSYIAEVQDRTRGQYAHKPGDSHSPEKRASVSYSDTKLSSKMDSMSTSRWTKLSEEEILSRSTTDSKHAMGKDYLTVPIPGCKLELEADEIESRVERRSLTDSTLIASSFESKYTKRSSERSQRTCAISEKESTRKQKIKEIETYAKWLAQGCEKPLPSHRREDKTLTGSIVKHYTDEKVKQRSKCVIEPISLKKPRNQVYDCADSGIFSIFSDEEPLASANMNAPLRFEVEREAREKHRLGHLICSADV